MLSWFLGVALAAPNTLTIASATDIGSLVPLLTENELDSAIVAATQRTLVGAAFDCRLAYSPEIAKEWSWSRDGLQLSMTLRDDLTFSDGHPITAEDVAYTYGLIGSEDLETNQRSYVAGMVPKKRPLVIDDHHLEWHFTEAYSQDTQLAHVGTVAILPAHLLTDVPARGISGHTIARDPLASGPWQVGDYQPGARLVLEPNLRHVEGRPHLEQVIFRVIPDYETRLHELKSGGVDVVADIHVGDLEALEALPDIRLHRRGWRSVDYVAWNLKDPLFTDLRVRQALAKAVDVDRLINELLTIGETAFGKRSVGTFTPALCDLNDPALAPIAFAVDEAKAMMAAAGWVDADGDGVLDKGGKSFRFTLRTTRGNQRREAAAKRIKEMLAVIGVEVTVEAMETSQFFHRVEQGDFDAAMAGWSAALFVDPSRMWKTKGSFNFPGYSSAVADDLIARGLSTHDPKRAAKIWQKLQATIHADQPYLFLYWMDEFVAVNRRVEVAETTIFSPYDDLHRWRLRTP